MQKQFETTITVPVPLHDPVKLSTLMSIIRESRTPEIVIREGTVTRSVRTF